MNAYPMKDDDISIPCRVPAKLHKAEPYQVVDKFYLVFATQLLLVDL